MTSAEIFLSYEAELLAVLSRESDRRESENRAIAAHRTFDPDMQIYEKWISGRVGERSKEKVQDNFECAVQWLMGFCGLSPLHYGHCSLDNEIDLIGQWREGQVVVAVECTTNKSDLATKISQMHRRATELRLRTGDRQVLPVLATSLTPEQLTQTEKETAYRDGIVLASSRELASLHKMAVNRIDAREIVQYLNVGGAAESDEGNPSWDLPLLGRRQSFMR